MATEQEILSVLHSIDRKTDRLTEYFARLPHNTDSEFGVTSANLNIIHTALFGWPMDEFTPKEEILRCKSLKDAAMILLASKRFAWDSREALPMWPHDKWVCTEFFGLRIWVNLHDNFVSWGVMREDWENEDVAFVLNLLSDGDGMVDVGANVGVYALQSARKVGPSGRVYAFEPQPDVNEMLKRSATDNGFAERMSIIHAGVGAEDRLMQIWRHHHTNQGASRMVDHEQVVTGSASTVQLVRLDSIHFDRKIKVLKVDIEGFEPKMVQGGQKFFRDHQPIVLTEFYPNAIRHGAGVDPTLYFNQWIELGYQLRYFDTGKVKGPFGIEDVKRHDNGVDLFNVVCVPNEIDPDQLPRRQS